VEKVVVLPLSPESRAKYARILAELAARTDCRPTPDCSPNGCDLEIDVLILRYLQFPETYYSNSGKPTQGFACMVEALMPLRELFGSISANQFGPKRLKTVQQPMVDKCNLCRNVVNRPVGRIRRVFKWAVAEEPESKTWLGGALVCGSARISIIPDLGSRWVS